MLYPDFSNIFNKDLKAIEKRGKDITKIKAVMFDLICENPLPPKNREHKLIGNYKDHTECHIEPDWLLIYLIKDDTITFSRTGTHSDL